jgi:hypothetical protein
MSENLNQDFSQYDLMETEELEKILRLDAETPEGAESDTELLLYVMEVLARRRNNNHDIAGNNAHSAWSEFQEHYMPEVILDNPKKEKLHHTSPWLRRAVSVAAVLVLVFSIPVTAKALSIGEIWDIFARWAKETFSFVNGENTEVSEPTPEDQRVYSSLQELLQAENCNSSMVPTYIPNGYVLDKFEKDFSPIQKVYTAIYLNMDKELQFQIRTHLSEDVQNNEIENEPIEIYVSDGITYYIFNNLDQIFATWTYESYECFISGDLSVEEVKMMIDSIGKG